MLKFNLKKERLNFGASWITTVEQMTDDNPDDDLTASLLDGDLQDSWDRIVQFLDGGGD